MASLVTLPALVLHLIYDQLTDAKDRATLARTYKRLNLEIGLQNSCKAILFSDFSCQILV